MNEINIILEGKEYQIDIQKAKELGVIKEKDQRCKSWEEFRNRYASKPGYFFNMPYNCMEEVCHPTATAEQLTKGEAIAIAAFSKLLKLRRDWIGTWEPNRSIAENKYCIIVKDTHINVDCFSAIQHIFSFPTRKMAEEFLECFKDLFKQCKYII